LAQPYLADDLARGIAWVLDDSDRHQWLRQEARLKAEEAFDGARQAGRYVRLFEEILLQTMNLGHGPRIDLMGKV
jgi:glycosyltransferase involved in cell wall biosynthesis